MLFESKRGQVGGGVIAIVVGVILFVAVAIPIVSDVVADGNFTGTTATILNLMPILIAVGALYLVVRSVM